MKIILLNGPPRSGKDHAASAIIAGFVATHTTRWEKFSMPHKRAFAAMSGKTCSPRGDVDYYEQHKDEVIPWLGVSYRQWQIDFSEKFMKPLYGEDIFARMLLQRIGIRLEVPGYLCVISDCGFQIEVDTLLDRVGDNALLIRLHRNDCDFRIDSRGYVTWVNRDLMLDIDNDGTTAFDIAIRSRVDEFLRGA